MVRKKLVSKTSLLTPSTKVDNILRKQGRQFIVLHQSVFKLLQHLKDKQAPPSHPKKSLKRKTQNYKSMF